MNDKRIFEQFENDIKPGYQAKQQFDPEQATIEPDELIADLYQGFEQVISAKSSWWSRAVNLLILLFLFACIAQSVHWLWRSWQNSNWIYLIFATVSLLVVLVGVGAIVKELANLSRLRRHLLTQQQSQKLQQISVQSTQEFDYQYAQRFCLDIANNMQLDPQHLNLVQWKHQINEAHTGREVAKLFSLNVLYPIDQKAKKLISQNAIESAIVIGVTPLALVDIFFIAWRNIRLINQLTRLYGIELGYLSRLRLIKLVLMNMALAGATELLQEVGIDWLSQDITAKLSARVAQGIGVGLLIARLGIKTMEFCRPLAFQQDEKPRLHQIHGELLSYVKKHIFNMTKVKQTEKTVKIN